MSRKLKPYQVDTIHNRNTGESVPVFLDRETKTFFVQVGQDRFEAPTEIEAKKLGQKALDAFLPYEWHQVIEVDFDLQNGNTFYRKRGQPRRREMTFSFERFQTKKICAFGPTRNARMNVISSFGFHIPTLSGTRF